MHRINQKFKYPQLKTGNMGRPWFSIDQGVNVRRNRVSQNGDNVERVERYERPRRKVVEWRTLEVLYDRREAAQKSDISLVIEIKQPVFEDGSHGFPKLGAKLSRGDHFLRFVCFDGDVSELQALFSLFHDVKTIGFDRFQAAYDGHVATYRSASHYGDNEGLNRRVGVGVPRFNSENRGDRRRRRRDREEWE
jgi:hypothetical protein